MEIKFRGRPMKGHHSRAISALPPRFSSIGVRLATHICQQALQVQAQPAEVASQAVRLSLQSSVSQHGFGATASIGSAGHQTDHILLGEDNIFKGNAEDTSCIGMRPPRTRGVPGRLRK